MRQVQNLMQSLNLIYTFSFIAKIKNYLKFLDFKTLNSKIKIHESVYDNQWKLYNNKKKLNKIIKLKIYAIIFIDNSVQSFNGILIKILIKFGLFKINYSNSINVKSKWNSI